MNSKMGEDPVHTTKHIRTQCLFVLVSLLPSVVIAQVNSGDITAALNCFEGSRIAGKTMSDCPSVITVEAMVVRPNIVSQSALAELMDGLERLALSSSNKRVRIAAAAWMATPGQVKGKEESVRGIVARLERVYDLSNEWSVRTAIIGQMKKQAERAEAVAFLKKIAEEGGKNEMEEYPPSYTALTILAMMGPWGKNALRALYEAKTVKSPAARGYLELLAKHGFREPN